MSVPTDVLLLCWRDTGHPQGGGSERYLERVGAEFAARGSRVTLLTAHYPGAARKQTVDGVRIVRAGGRLTVYPRALATVAAARWGRGRLAGYRPDVVVDTQNGVPFFARLVAPAPTVVLVHHCHREQWPVAGPVLARVGWWIESRIAPRIHRRNRYITVSEPSAAELTGLGVDRHRITVVRGGVDPVPNGIDVTGRSGGLRLIAVSRLVPHKQIEDALEVVATLSAAGADVHLDVVGDGWWAGRLRAQAQSLGVVDQVSFHGHVSDRRKHELLAAADVHLMPSRKEGWGLAVIEAAQHAVPTIGYRSSAGLADSIVDGVTGVLVDDAVQLARAAAALAADPDRRRALGEAARDRAEQFSWAGTADGFAAVFDEVCG
ncbi:MULTISPECIES: glycosyltransferase family 4 protein [Gordonia]|uniref:Glycosyltransferase family 4 protein n=1 Tax=Gordonia cholesterolivorans TaxID=559625 RepID=A0ABN3HS84_9ACTN|nr:MULTISPECIES: glycosyltransferase family 4 protein [Gordonia]KJR06732.1 glycosyl transferase [Gordonia sihwensis]KXT58377.1 glycosyl transferase [Gordonia sp. QH-12]WFN93100.1 glycosyltransferase family 4 protein [Gordonia sihwensis]